MNQLFVGSMNLTKLVDAAKKGHSAFSKSAKDGNVYFNFAAWANDEPNEFGQHMSVSLNSSKDMKEKEGKMYFGNAKKMDTQQPVKANDINDDFSNIPVRQPVSVIEGASTDFKEPADDLPF